MNVTGMEGRITKTSSCQLKWNRKRFSSVVELMNGSISCCRLYQALAMASSSLLHRNCWVMLFKRSFRVVEGLVARRNVRGIRTGLLHHGEKGGHTDVDNY